MNKFSVYITLAVFFLVLQACDKKLSEPPANARVEGTAITDQKTAQTVLNGAYYRFAGVNANNVTDWTYHQVTGGMLSGMLGYGFGPTSDERNDNVNPSYTGQSWIENYLLINAANAVIDGVSTLPNSAFVGNRKDEILGESRFLRAYGHFRLLMYFAEWFKPESKNGILIRNEFTKLSRVPKMRSTVAESYAMVLQDLDFAIGNAPVTNPKHYATKWAAMALKMRVLLSRGQQSDFIEADNLGNTLITTGPYALENNLKDIFYAKGLSSQEVIFGVKPQPNQEAFYFIVSRAYYPGQNSIFVAKQAFKNLLQNDPRGSWMVGAATPYQSYSPNTYYFLKYIGFGANTSQLSETAYAFRLSEVYLMRAEAILRSNGGDLNTAKTLIKTVMSKAGITNFTAVDNANTVDELLLQNYYEVARNLTSEDGIEWLALMRLPFTLVKQLRPSITSTQQFYFPVPRSEFDSNPLFGPQNTGYDK